MTALAAIALRVSVVLAATSLAACSSASDPTGSPGSGADAQGTGSASSSGSSSGSTSSSGSASGSNSCEPITADAHDAPCLDYMQKSCAAQLAACQADCASAAYVDKCLASWPLGTTECLSAAPTKAVNDLFVCVDFPDPTCYNPTLEAGAPPAQDSGGTDALSGD